MERTVRVEKTGVMDIGYDAIQINSESIHEAIMNAIDALHPKKDYNGCFAARMTVEVELLGDLEDAI